jgi:hypothetical protein
MVKLILKYVDRTCIDIEVTSNCGRSLHTYSTPLIVACSIGINAMVFTFNIVDYFLKKMSMTIINYPAYYLNITFIARLHMKYPTKQQKLLQEIVNYVECKNHSINLVFGSDIMENTRLLLLGCHSNTLDMVKLILSMCSWFNAVNNGDSLQQLHLLIAASFSSKAFTIHKLPIEHATISGVLYV